MTVGPHVDKTVTSTTLQVTPTSPLLAVVPQGLILWTVGPYVDKLVTGKDISNYEWSTPALLLLIVT